MKSFPTLQAKDVVEMMWAVACFDLPAFDSQAPDPSPWRQLRVE